MSTAIQSQPHEPWVSGIPLIAHGLGRVGGKDRTHSWHALDRAYRRGLRLLQADVALTSDGVPVLVSGWTADDRARLGWEHDSDAPTQPMTARQFKKTKIHGKYRTLTLADLHEFLREHADVKVLLDVGDRSTEEATTLYRAVAEVVSDPHVRDRCMVTVTSPETADAVRELGAFARLNLRVDTSRYASIGDLVQACNAEGVQTVTIDADASDEHVAALRDAGIGVLQFAVNTAAEAAAVLTRGADAVGTDTVSPQQLKRAQQVWVRELSTYRDDRGNQIVYEGETPPPSVEIRIRGRNNRLTVSDKARLSRLDVIFDNDNARVEIGPTRLGIPQLSMKIRAGQDATVTVGKDVTSTGVVFVSATEGTSVTIGDDVMFAKGVEVRADDAHAIFDVATGKRLNHAAPIVISDHVWLAKNVTVLRGVTIGQGSVIGFGSLVTRDVPNNCIAVGTPAVPTRKDIAWERPHLDNYPPYKPDASVIPVSRYWATTSESGSSASVARRTLWHRAKRKLRGR